MKNAYYHNRAAAGLSPLALGTWPCRGQDCGANRFIPARNTAQARFRLPECDNMRTNWLNVLQRNTQNNKDYSLPDVGEQIEVLLDENGEDGVILGVVYSRGDKPPFSN